MPPRRLLVVDDVRDVAQTIALRLTDKGHEVEWLTDPRGVMEAARRFRPHLIFLDLLMPDLDGYQLARMLRAEFGFEHLRLVALTGYGDEADRVASRQAGFDAHVSKPADSEVIDSILKTIFEGKRAVR